MFHVSPIPSHIAGLGIDWDARTALRSLRLPWPHLFHFPSLLLTRTMTVA